ncbi:TPR Domain containing protein [Histomonas meleagridis]|uniref:TPR Domain containing protein n=1 Tax=Histomonas meleagridis TaxID=135588 RepID=UPI003559D4EA|nr:TPR Domain containing protein [Histomonas meleagridis]
MMLNSASNNDVSNVPTDNSSCTAEDEKLKGNECYRMKDYNTALSHYCKAISLDPENCIYYSNKSSALLMMKRYEDAMEAVLLAIEKAQLHNSGSDEFIAKCYVKLANTAIGCGKERGAYTALQESLRIHEDPTVRKMLNDLKKKLDIK